MKSKNIQLAQGFLLCWIVLMITGCHQQETPPAAEAETEMETTELPVLLTESWTLAEGLDRPESAIYDAEREVIYVSNLVGPGDAIDGVGYISKVGLDGSMIEQEWISGLNAPKGLTRYNNTLYGTDINALLEINIDTGEIVNRYEVEGDVYLNDVTVLANGTVYVTDSRYSKIYQLSGGELSVWFEGPSIQMPNGIHVIGEELWVVAGDGSTDNPGTARYLQAISLENQRVRAVMGTQPEGALDAVEPDGQGGIFVTDWGSGRLMYFDEERGFSVLQQLGQGAADVDYIVETNMLYVPVMMEGELIAYQVGTP